MSRGLTDVPLVVLANKTDLLGRDQDKYRQDISNKVSNEKLERK